MPLRLIFADKRRALGISLVRHLIPTRLLLARWTLGNHALYPAFRGREGTEVLAHDVVDGDAQKVLRPTTVTTWILMAGQEHVSTLFARQT